MIDPRAQLSGSQEMMISELRKVGWENEVVVSEDPYTLYTYWQIAEDEQWILLIEANRRLSKVSAGHIYGLLVDQAGEKEFAQRLKHRLEELTAVRARFFSNQS